MAHTVTRPGGRGRTVRRPRDAGDGTHALRQVVSLVLGQLSFIAALAFYFGRVSTGAWLQYFGLDTSLVDLSPTDYVLRSIGPSYWPIMGLGVLVVAALFVDPLIRAKLSVMPAAWRRVVFVGTAVVCSTLLVIAILGLLQVWIFPRSVPVIPLAISAAVAIATYATVVHSAGNGARSLLHKAQFVALTGLLAGGIFWAWGSYAGRVGTLGAQQMALDLPYRTEVSVFSGGRLGLDGHGVTFDAYGDQDSVYHYRYTGMRLLLRSGDRYFLVPKDWERGRDAVFVLSESQDVRIQFVAPPSPP